MTSRQRVATALNHREPDRVPVDLGSCGPTGIQEKAYRSLLAVMGLEEEVRIWDEIGQLALPSEDVLGRVGSDVRGVRVGAPGRGGERLKDGAIRDAWGIVWRRPESATCYNLAEYPLAGNVCEAGLRAYDWPDGRDPARVAGLKERARKLHEETEYAVLGEMSGHILERGQMLRGFDAFLYDLVDRPAFAELLMDKILEVELDIVDTFLGAVGPYLDVMAFKDDLGTQAGPLISTALFRRFIKPRLAALAEAIRKKSRAKIWFHSCGSAWYAIPDLIEMGIEVLNPVQVAAKHMDTQRLKREYGRDLSFWGAIDTQRVLPFGTGEEIAAEVRRRIADLAPGGGYVLASVHNLEPDVPGASIAAMFGAARHYGRYPVVAQAAQDQPDC